MASTFGERLRELREKKQLTQQQVGDLIDKTRTTINAYEIGKTIPPANVVKKLALLYGVTTDYLLTDIDKKTIVISGLNTDEAEALLQIDRMIVSLLRRKNGGEDRD